MQHIEGLCAAAFPGIGNIVPLGPCPQHTKPKADWPKYMHKYAPSFKGVFLRMIQDSLTLEVPTSPLSETWPCPRADGCLHCVTWRPDLTRSQLRGLRTHAVLGHTMSPCLLGG